MSETNANAAARRILIHKTLVDVRELLAAGPLTREVLDRITHRLELLAKETHLFTAADFPPPAPHEGDSTRYRLNPEDADDDVALYLNSLNPGKTSVPHNHTTWAVIVAVAGDELNRVYERLDDGSTDQAEIRQVREKVVRPGHSINFLPEDLHSIHVTGQTPTLHFHLYGQPLETLVGRIGIDPETGRVINYNKTQMRPSEEVRA